MSAERVPIMIAQGHEQKNAGQENDDDGSDRCSGEQLEMKMPLTKKPVADAAEDRPSAAFQLCCYGGVDRRIYHKCVQSSSPASPTFCKAARPHRTQSRVSTKFLPSTNLSLAPRNANRQR